MAKFNARQFTKNGFVRNESGDFWDDGTKFKSYMYKDMEVTYATGDDFVYISPHGYNYVINKYSNITIWHLTDKKWYTDIDMYNGAERDVVDINVLVNTIENFMTNCHILNQNLNNQPVPMQEIMDRLNYEVNMASRILKDFKDNFDCFDTSLNDYELKRYIDYYNQVKNAVDSIIKEIKKIEEYGGDNYINYVSTHKKEAIYRAKYLEVHGYLNFNENSYMLREMISYLSSRN